MHTFLIKNVKTCKHRHRWKDIEMNITAIGYVEKHDFGTGPMAEFCGIIYFSRVTQIHGFSYCYREVLDAKMKAPVLFNKSVHIQHNGVVMIIQV